jgi:hypothetical protein
MYIKFSNHAIKRLKEKRQGGISKKDLIKAAKAIPGKISYAMKFKNNISSSGRRFHFTLIDIGETRFIITVVGGDRDEKQANWFLFRT